jgi:hypothetical protein
VVRYSRWITGGNKNVSNEGTTSYAKAQKRQLWIFGIYSFHGTTEQSETTVKPNSGCDIFKELKIH